MRVHVDHSACQGHGRCYSDVRDVFVPDEEGYCALVAEEVPAGLEDAVIRAAGSCPERAIEVEGERS